MNYARSVSGSVKPLVNCAFGGQKAHVLAALRQILNPWVNR
ncbi:hypothetical protein ASD8599_04088 [Ascidiaceihabitans donghaensis]|uniref:Uncharacterized protein n=1 Tax=Ascidiaceihabitans donghaensis TaxID=1510460 RepID=A0A2R8BPW7_9RHOB|nr:hypothetical protein ASD8599_04088 [Ascidiaceihabitans donghaensis]